ncbi:MAG: translocase [Candidatus Aminicenantes bacterium]|nr:translocase [Candidatus Aminicenantes bacterium]
MTRSDDPQKNRTPASRPNPGYAFLRLFTDIRPGEAAKALLLTLNIFLLLLAYYLIKPVREALLLVDKDAPRIKSYLSGAQAVLLVFVILGFSWLASKVSRHKLITWVTLFFVSNLAVFYVLHLAGVGAGVMGIVFFIWIGIFNLLVVAQFWGFANDLYAPETGKRIFPLIAFGATLGAVAGSRVAKLIIGPLGLYNMMLLSGALLLACIVLAVFIHKREVAFSPGEEPPERAAQTQPLKPGDGFSLVVKTRYLFFIALAILVYNFINTIGEYIISDVATRAGLAAVAQGKAESMGVFIGGFFSDYQFLTNTLALVIQLFLVSRIFKWLGVGGALFVLPFIALGGYAFISMGATLLLVKWVKSLENGTDYSLMNTTKAALFLVTPREEKYKAKAAIDTFFVRGGDALAALAVFVGTTFLGLSIERFAVLNIVFVLLWISLSLMIYKHYKLRRGRAESAVKADS